MVLTPDRVIMSSVKIFFALLTVLIPNVRSQTIPTTLPVQTEGGPVVGLNLSTVYKNVPYSSFRGIPFANPPIGSLRFQPPQRKTPWMGTLYAFQDQSPCVQAIENKIVGSEDCLYLNVYSPNTNRYSAYDIDGLKPVVVWIHGGAFQTGNCNSSYYGPDFFLDNEIIVVTIQYRLGALGFLNINHPLASGNYGLKDQNLALKWVKNNIAAFGGDPYKVTLMGHSSGGVSVDLHVLSAMSRGLFHQTISMSASPLCKYWAFQSNAEARVQAFLLGDKFGVRIGDGDGLIKKLLQVPARELIAKAKELPMIPFRPTLEHANVAPKQPKFLRKCAPERYRKGNYNKGLRHMMGFTSNEIVSMVTGADDLIRWHESAAKSVDSEILATNFKALSTAKKNAFSKMLEELSDLYFVTGIDMKQRFLAATNDAPVYYYRYNMNWKEFDNGRILDGAAHEDELPHLFYRPHLKIPIDHPEVVKTREKLVRMWTQFIRFGDPTPLGALDQLLDGVTWPDSGKDGLHLEIAEKLVVGPRPVSNLVKLLQQHGLGDSDVLNDCNPNVLSNFINNIASIPGIIKAVLDRYSNNDRHRMRSVNGTTNDFDDLTMFGIEDGVESDENYDAEDDFFNVDNVESGNATGRLIKNIVT